MFVDSGTTFDWDYLFGEVFTGHEILAVVRIPDVDHEDVDAINELLDAYEDDPETFLADSYEIAKVYH